MHLFRHGAPIALLLGISAGALATAPAASDASAPGGPGIEVASPAAEPIATASQPGIDASADGTRNGPAQPTTENAQKGPDLDALAARLDQQLKDLEALQATVAIQQAALSEQQQLINAQQTHLEEQQRLLQDMNAQLSQFQETTTSTLQEGDVLLTERLEFLEQRLNEEPEDPLAALADESFPGSWRVPGTNAAMRIGGYVKMNIVNSFDPLVTRDRFIVGTIPPVDEIVEGAEKGAVLTVQQSRVNLDLRDKTSKGMLRAFVEGDFAGSGETFRLRHAYGQFGSMLAGKTWSTFMDLGASPEEIDFEGINGRINVRQSQLRFFPQIGKNLNLRIAAEDPAPDISGGEGANTLWDLIISLDWSNTDILQGSFFEGWSARTALIGRQIKARQFDSSEVEKEGGWGITASGEIPFTRFGENDHLLWQLTAGEGIGRYINDLGTVGGSDAIFSPDGELLALPVFAGYLSYQHGWNERWRSNATLSWVSVDTYGFQSSPEYVETFGAPYERTLRASLNVLFNPVRRLELGAELLWGERKNANDTRGDATQLQVSARYLY
jgi:hypothetical protein